jgi:hypothetical protein
MMMGGDWEAATVSSLAAEVALVITSATGQSWPASSGAATRGSAPGPPRLQGFRPDDVGSCALLPVVWPPPLQARKLNPPRDKG